MIYQADIHDVNNLLLGTPQLVISEPYYEEEFYPLWGELMRFTMRVGAPYLVVFSDLERYEEHLEYLNAVPDGLVHAGTVTLIFDGNEGKKAIIFGGIEGRLAPGVRIPGQMWPFEQFAPFILQFTELGDLVCDPFLGSNQAAKVIAFYLGRRFEGFDINHAAIDQSANTIRP